MQENVQLFTERQKRQRLWWLMPKAFDWLASTFYIGVFIVAFLPSPASVVWWRVFLLASVILTLLLIDRLEYWRYGDQVPMRAAVFLFTGRIVLIVCAILLEGLNFTPFLFLLPPYLAVVYFGNRTGYAIAALAIAAYLVPAWLHDPYWYLKPLSAFLAITFSLAVVFVVLMARIVGLEKAGHVREQVSRIRAEELLAEVEHAHRQLQMYAERVAELATIEERNRVARDIHDGLGHALIAISVQLEKALVYYDKQPQEAFQAISDAKRVVREALQDVRRSVRALRTEHEPFACIQGITLLIDQLRATGLTVDFDTSGSEEQFPIAVRMALYRVAQEGFTNIQKHAQASRVEAGLYFTEAEARLCMRDNGCGFDVRQRFPQQAASQGEYGLRGIRERVELIGGTFHLESQVGSGTSLLVTVTRTGLTGPLQRDALQEIAVLEEGLPISGRKSV
ncbi:MAG TPA: sensor histidine kinase [Ktedonobacteraceae bacterium]|nr:sensor histidine kinase [Ktedonobacteraceae bacterium]